MNEVTFFLHIFSLLLFILLALRLGKEALIGCLAIQIILGNLFVLKQMECFGLQITCTDVYTIGSLLTMNLLQSIFGIQLARKTLLTLFFLLFLVMIMSQFQLYYTPSAYDRHHGAFQAILETAPRIMLFSTLSALITQKIDLECFRLIRKRRSMMTSFTLSSLISQGFDTLFFSYTALYGMFHSMRDLILMSYLVKIIIIAAVAPFTLLAKRWIRDEPLQV